MTAILLPRRLDDYSTFRRVYEVPILRSRAPDCTAKEREMGEARTAQVPQRFTLNSNFFLNDNYSYLPLRRVLS
jgi:DNA repair and recombination protein RAD54B